MLAAYIFNKVPPINFREFLTPRNRGLLLDVIVFGVNLVLMTLLVNRFATLSSYANQDSLTSIAMLLFCLASAFLQPVGAVLKRRPAHRRVPNLALSPPWNWLGHPFFYFLSQLLFLIAVSGFVTDLIAHISPTSVGRNTTNYLGLAPWLFTVFFFGVPALAIANTFVAYFYFRPPGHKAWLSFLDSPQSDTLGDACIFLNIILYQIFWGYLISELPKDYRGVGERLFTLGFTALLIYFPPRIFYLAEYGKRRQAWVLMLLANLPIILRVLLT